MTRDRAPVDVAVRDADAPGPANCGSEGDGAVVPSPPKEGLIHMTTTEVECRRSASARLWRSNWDFRAHVRGLVLRDLRAIAARNGLRLVTSPVEKLHWYTGPPPHGQRTEPDDMLFAVHVEIVTRAHARTCTPPPAAP
jgi:hypothetical protein